MSFLLNHIRWLPNCRLLNKLESNVWIEILDEKTKESNLRSHSSDKWHTRQVILPLWLLEFGNWIEHFRDRNGHGSVVNPVPDATVGAPVGPRLEEGYQPAQAPPLFPNRHCCRRNRPPPLSCFFFYILAETRLAQRPHLFPFFFFF